MRTLISDPGDERLADYRHLTDPARRIRVEEEGGFFIVEGWEAVRRLLTTDWVIRSILIAADRQDRLDVPAPVPAFVVSRAVLEATVGFQLHRGVVAAVARRPYVELSMIARAASSLAVLEGLNDHENLGSIFRSAAALGIDGVALDPTCADPFYRRSVRVSMGTVLTIPVARSRSWPGDLVVLKQHGFTLIGLTPNPAAAAIDDVEPPAKAALLLGSEAAGLSQGALAAADVVVRIPQRREVDSLNVGHAAAIAFHRFGSALPG